MLDNYIKRLEYNTLYIISSISIDCHYTIYNKLYLIGLLFIIADIRLILEDS